VLTLFDSHCHLTDSAFAGEVDAVIERARQAGVRGMVTIASDLEDSRVAEDTAREHAGIWWTAGIHPHAAGNAGADARLRLTDRLARTGAVAVGEAGLDYHYDYAPREAQRQVFSMQMEVAAELGLPIIVHSREAEADTAAVIRAAGSTVAGVLHCFTSGPALLEAGLTAGWFVSFAGLITFRRYQDADLLRAVPEDRLLLETDSPYLAPTPLRGKRNEPSFLVHTCEAAAAIRGVSSADLAAATTANAYAFYQIPVGGVEEGGSRDFAGTRP
jgi:TatD DNase family protein